MMRVPRLVSLLALCGALTLAGSAQMVSPEIDETGGQPEPFSYFSRSTDQLSVMGAPSGAEITPEGSLYTGFGELMFFVGPEQTPITARVRTLEQGYLPVISYTVKHLGITYRFTMFAAAVGGDQNFIVNFVRVTATNDGTEPRAAFLTTAFRYQGEQTTDNPSGDNRFPRPIAAGGPGQFHQPGEAFNPRWTYAAEGNAFLRDGKVMYCFPTEPAPALSLTLRSHYNRIHPVTATALDVQPTTPTSAATYTFALAPGASRVLDFRVPLLPPDAGSAASERLSRADFDHEHAETIGFWMKMLARGMQIEVSETKVVDTFRASLVYDLEALNEVDTNAIQTVNQFQYHRFYLRDAADFARMYDATGYSDVAARVLRFFASRQQPDGNFLSQPSQYDGWGEAMWAYGEHFRRTRDLAFAKAVYPAMVRAVDWLVKARAEDPLHIMPRSDVRDNEYVAAHLTGYNFLALDGLQSAIEIAEATDHPDDSRRFQEIKADYQRCFFALLDQAARRNQGAIPPALDAEGWQGTDWGNLLSLTPQHVLDPHDPRVAATLASSQSRYEEGITTYSEPDDGTFLHHYLTIKNTLTELEIDDARDQHQAMRELYAELLHTSSTHEGFEYAIRPWGSRDFEGNLAPHGWFAADYRGLLRNMMVREDGVTLHLLSAVSPEWIGGSKSIHVADAPTYFGRIDFDLRMPNDTSAILHLSSSFDHPPAAIVLHLPWFMEATSISADGVKVDDQDGMVRLPAKVKEVRIAWRRRPGASSMTYEKTVRSYKAEYRRRYDLLLSTGRIVEDKNVWQVPDN